MSPFNHIVDKFKNYTFEAWFKRLNNNKRHVNKRHVNKRHVVLLICFTHTYHINIISYII